MTLISIEVSFNERNGELELHLLGLKMTDFGRSLGFEVFHQHFMVFYFLRLLPRMIKSRWNIMIISTYTPRDALIGSNALV